MYLHGKSQIPIIIITNIFHLVKPPVHGDKPEMTFTDFYICKTSKIKENNRDRSCDHEKNCVNKIRMHQFKASGFALNLGFLFQLLDIS